MGLDMYLTKKTYVKNWPHLKTQHKISVEADEAAHPHIKPERISYIVEEVAYWRKANHVHRYFVERVQNGTDDCGEYPVRKEILAELVGLCKQILQTVETVDGEMNVGYRIHPDGRVEEQVEIGKVIAQTAIAESLLPTCGGFFFGSTEYDEYYLEDLRLTIEQLEPLLQEIEDTEHCWSEFYYQSSW